jgi:O-Antigen ligase
MRLWRWLTSRAGLVTGVAGFLAGYWLMWNVELQLLWLVIMVLPGLSAGWQSARAEGAGRDCVLWCMALLVAWTLAVGLVRHFPRAEWHYRWEYLAGAVALPPVLAAVWLVCRRGDAAALLRACAWSGAAAAVAGLVWWYAVLAVESPGARLRNPLVYGGLHPVATGLFGAFAACVAAHAAAADDSRKRRGLWLTVFFITLLAVFFTISRGAILAVACGLLLLPVAAGWRRTWPVLAAAVAAWVCFQCFAEYLAPRPPASLAGQGGAQVMMETINADPTREFMARGDNGRYRFYEIAGALMDSWDKHLTGAGLWGPDDELERRTRGSADHFHSLPVATWVHSGIPGCLLLAVALAAGAHAAWRLRQGAGGAWLVLLGCGCGGLIFDGQSACSLVTHPRFEPLLFWVPLVAASALAARDKSAGSLRASRQGPDA